MKTSHSRLLVLVPVLVILASCVAGAAGPNAKLGSYLSVYMSNTVMNQYTYHNVTLSGSGYVVMESDANLSQYLVLSDINGNYMILTNSNEIAPVLSAFAALNYNNLPHLSYLKSAMQAYVKKIDANLTDCITETGSNPNVTTLIGAADQCQTIPVCNRVLRQFDGPDSTFGYGLLNFSLDDEILNSSLSTYFGLLSSINQQNAGTNIAELAGPIANINFTANKMGENPLFPTPPYVTVATCSIARGPLQQPWYCVATGYCEYVDFNDTALLNNITATQQQLSLLVPSPAKVLVYSAASASGGASLINAEEQKVNGVAYTAFLNATYPLYNSTVGKISALVSRTSNTGLSNTLASLKGSFSGILANGINANIVAENASFRALLSKAVSQYQALNRTYSVAEGYALNDTVASLVAQLNYKSYPPALAILSARLQAIDINMSSGVNSVQNAALISTLASTSNELRGYGPPLTMGYIVKLFDGGFASAFLSGSSATAPVKEAAAPLYAAIEAFIIGIVLLLLFYLLTYRRLSARKRLKKTRRASRAWIMLFAVLFVLVLIYTYATYSYAVKANSFIPFSYFTGSLKQSKSVLIALNGTAAYSNQSVVDCADTLYNVLKSQSKSVTAVDITNYTCVAGGTISPQGINCYDHALSAGVPVITLSGSGSGIVYSGIYGSVLYASGSSASGPSCLIAQLMAKEG
jgi:hypothetical protein